LLALILLVVGPAMTRARQATPSAFSVTPDPAECLVEPRRVESLGAALAPAAGVPTSAVPSDAAGQAEPADAATVAAITTTAHEFIACVNAGDLRRVFALYSDDFLRRHAEELGLGDPAGLDDLATPDPPPTELRWALLAVADVFVRPDGRAVARVIMDNPAGVSAEENAYFVFVPVEGRWLVDDVVVLVPATPIAE
jgi:hypothetical protein